MVFLLIEAQGENWAEWALGRASETEGNLRFSKETWASLWGGAQPDDVLYKFGIAPTTGAIIPV